MTDESKDIDQNFCKDCGTTENLTFDPDPFDEEIYHDFTDHWMCEDCRRQAWLDT